MPTAREARNKATFRRLRDAVHTGDLETVSKAIDEIVAPDLLFHAPVPMGATGAQALERVWEALLRAFPDLRVEIDDEIAEGDKVVFRNTVTGTHQGEYQGLPATGRPVRYQEIFVLRFADGRVAEIWGAVDVLTQMRQLGMVPGGPS